MSLTVEELMESVQTDAALRRVQRLQPVGGPGDKVFPPTYPGEAQNSPPRYILETRRIHGEDIECVLLDSVQSQANRMEDALVNALRDGRATFPHFVVDFSEAQGPNGISLQDLGEITCLEAPHRVFDAIIRDSQLDDTRFTETKHYEKLVLSRPADATAVFERSPASLLFGAWNSTGQGGGLGSRFARCIVSEITGVGAKKGAKSAVRIDPLGILATIPIEGTSLDWQVADKKKGKRPSEINHSNIITSVGDGGVTIDYALHTTVISCASLRRLRFPGHGERAEGAARTVLAALGLLAMTEQDAQGYALRSRCDLVREDESPFEIVKADGSTESFSLNREQAIALFEDSVAAAREAGMPWRDEPLRLKPQERLVELVAASRARALAHEAG